MYKTVTREIRHRFFKTRYEKSLQGVRTLSQKAPRPKANIIFFPGFREHIGLYGPLLDQFVYEGYNVFGCDPPNHGFSVADEKNRGFIENFNDYLRVGKAMAYYRLWSVPYKDIPTYFMGHSLGAVLILRLLELKIPLRKEIRGAVCFSTPLRVDHNINNWTRVARPLLEFLDPFLKGRNFWDRIPVNLPSQSTLDRFSRDDNFYKGPLYLRTAQEINKTVIAARESIRKVNIPVLFIHGDKDGIAPLSEVEKAIKMLPFANGTLRIVSGYDHHLVGGIRQGDDTLKRLTAPVMQWIIKNSH